MTIINVISRKIGVGDIALGEASFSYVDENGVSRTMQQLNATFIPLAVYQDSSGNVSISGTFSAGSIPGYVTKDGADNVTVTGSMTINGVLVLGGSNISFATGSGGIGYYTSTGAYIWAMNNPIKFKTGDTGTDVQASIGSNGIFSLYSLPAYVNNSAAIAGGLATGNLYRVLHDPSTNADPAGVCVVF